MVSKTKYPGICNNCGRKSEFYIRVGAHSIQLCSSCLAILRNESAGLLTQNQAEESEYNNSVETGLIQQKVVCHKEVENDKRTENN